MNHLLGFSGLTALVGNRIKWNVRPQAGLLPALVLQVISNIPDYGMSGETLLSSSRVQIDIWAEGYLQSLNIRDQVKECLSGLREEMSGVEIQGSFLIDERQSYEAAEETSRLHRVSMDFNIWYRKEV